MSVQPKEAGTANAESRETVVMRQAKEMLEKVPPVYDMFEVKDRSLSNVCHSNIIFRRFGLKCIRIILSSQE